MIEGDIILPTRLYPITFFEEWIQISEKAVENILPIYYVSNHGRIMSIIDGEQRILKPVLDKNGYHLICIHLSNKKDTCKRNQDTKRINRIVLISFSDYYGTLPENYKDLFVNHKDSIRSNNCLWNLEWSTPKENHDHAVQYGFKQIPDISGEKIPVQYLLKNKYMKL